MDIRLLLLLMFLCGNIISAQDNRVGVYLQDENKNPVQGAVVHFQGKHYLSDDTGRIVLVVSRKGEFPIKVSSLGFQDFESKIIIPYRDGEYIITLIEAVNELSQVIVTSNTMNKTTVYQQISKSELSLQAGESLAHTLRNLQGVSLIQTGATVAKPIIDGLHSNRVLILNNGVRQEGQQWGADHAPELDPTQMGKIQVVKGAESVRYGSDALGGVIILSPENLPFFDGLHGKFTTSFSSNGRKVYSGVGVEGVFPNYPNLAWRLQGATSKSGDLKTANYYLNNTGALENNFSLSAGYQIDKCQAELYFSSYRNELGVFLGSHIGNLDDLLMRFEIGRPLSTEPFSYSISAPRQRVLHNLLKMKIDYFQFLGGKFSAQYAFQYNKRQEYDVRRMNMTQTPVLDLELRSHNLDFSWQNNWNRWENQLGVSFSKQENYNKPGTGVTPIIPNFASVSYGAFAIVQYKNVEWNAEVGLRYDYKTLNADGYNSYSERYGKNHNFHNVTYVLGGNYVLSNNLSITSNVGLAWRSPHVSELYSDGLHHGEATYNQGDENLNSEVGIKWVNSIKLSEKKWSLSGEFFVQRIKNYIYDYPTGEIKSLFSGDFPLFQYAQHNAFFRGFSLKMHYKFLPQWEYIFQGDAVYATKQGGGYFPFIPPIGVNNEFKYSFDNLMNNRLLKKTEAYITHRWVDRQHRYDPEQELAPTTPEAYHLFEVGFRTNIPVRKGVLSVSVSCDNVFNTEYKDYTNRFRFYAHDIGRNFKIKTIYNF